MNGLIEEKRGTAGKEAFVHCVLLHSLTNDELVGQARQLNRYFENMGSEALESQMRQ
jgi:hypothetical protein